MTTTWILFIYMYSWLQNRRYYMFCWIKSVAKATAFQENFSSHVIYIYRSSRQLCYIELKLWLWPKHSKEVSCQISHIYMSSSMQNRRYNISYWIKSVAVATTSTFKLWKCRGSMDRMPDWCGNRNSQYSF